MLHGRISFRFVLFCFYFIFFSATAEVTGFDSPSVQGAGVSVSVITATAVSRYAPIRFPSVTHITRPLAGPYAQPGRHLTTERGGEQAQD